MLKVRLFGSGEASYEQTPLDGFPARKPYFLLSYLLLNRRYPLQREQLAAVFWAEYPTQKSRTYLRHALWRLRQTLADAGASPDEYLLAGDESIAFVQASRYWLDVEEFEHTVARYEDVSGPLLRSDQAEHLEEAVTLYSGELLEGIYEDWCLYDRERLYLLHVDTLKKLIAYHECNGTYERGLTFGARMLAHDKTLERVHQRMMRLYWLAGDRNAALAQYKRCEQILREELDMPPMAETRRLYEQMLHNEYTPEHCRTTTQDDRPPATSAQNDERVQPAVRQTLRKVQRLQSKLEETGAELHRLERLLNGVLSGFQS